MAEVAVVAAAEKGNQDNSKRERQKVSNPQYWRLHMICSIRGKRSLPGSSPNHEIMLQTISNVRQHQRGIDRNCNVLPLSLDDLLNYTTLMLKFCTNKRIRASLLRQVCFFWEERGCFAPKKGVTLHPRATDFQEKNPLQAQSKYSHSEYFAPPTYIGI